MPSRLARARQRSQGLKLLDGRDDVVDGLLDGAEKLVGHSKAGKRVLDGRQAAAQCGADVTDQDVWLISVVDISQVDLTIQLELKARAELVSDDGLIEASGEFVRLLHDQELARLE